jgi:hypothetical protein
MQFSTVAVLVKRSGLQLYPNLHKPGVKLISSRFFSQKTGFQQV